MTVTVLYPKHENSHFDHDYYLRTHIPLLQSRWTSTGLERVELLRGTPGPDGNPPTYELIALLTFTSTDHFQKSIAAHGTEIIGDIANFTNVEPVIQLNEPTA